jgi:hypothetical protein
MLPELRPPLQRRKRTVPREKETSSFASLRAVSSMQPRVDFKIFPTPVSTRQWNGWLREETIVNGHVDLMAPDEKLRRDPLLCCATIKVGTVRFDVQVYRMPTHTRCMLQVKVQDCATFPELAVWGMEARMRPVAAWDKRSSAHAATSYFNYENVLTHNYRAPQAIEFNWPKSSRRCVLEMNVAVDRPSTEEGAKIDASDGGLRKRCRGAFRKCRVSFWKDLRTDLVLDEKTPELKDARATERASKRQKMIDHDDCALFVPRKAEPAEEASPVVRAVAEPEEEASPVMLQPVEPVAPPSPAPVLIEEVAEIDYLVVSPLKGGDVMFDPRSETPFSEMLVTDDFTSWPILMD